MNAWNISLITSALNNRPQDLRLHDLIAKVAHVRLKDIATIAAGFSHVGSPVDRRKKARWVRAGGDGELLENFQRRMVCSVEATLGIRKQGQDHLTTASSQRIPCDHR